MRQGKSFALASWDSLSEVVISEGLLEATSVTKIREQRNRGIAPTIICIAVITASFMLGVR